MNSFVSCSSSSSSSSASPFLLCEPPSSRTRSATHQHAANALRRRARICTVPTPSTQPHDNRTRIFSSLRSFNSPVRTASVDAAATSLPRRAPSSLVSPFVHTASSHAFVRRASREIISPAVTSFRHVANGRSDQRLQNARPGHARAFFWLFLIPVVAAAAAGFAVLFAVAEAIRMAVTAIAVFALAAIAIPMVIAVFPAALAVFGVAGLASLGIFWVTFDRILCVFLLANFANGSLGFAKETYRLNHARKRTLELLASPPEFMDSNGVTDGVTPAAVTHIRQGTFKELLQWPVESPPDTRVTNEQLLQAFRSSSNANDPRFDWSIPSLVSLVPGVNGCAWLLATWHSDPYLSKDSKQGMLRNAFAYGLPSLVSLLSLALLGVTGPTGTSAAVASSMPSFLARMCGSACTSGGVGAAAAAAAGAGASVGVVSSVIGVLSGMGSAWWVCVVVGVMHLQMERVRVRRMMETEQLEKGLGDWDESQVESSRVEEKKGRGKRRGAWEMFLDADCGGEKVKTRGKNGKKGEEKLSWKQLMTTVFKEMGKEDDGSWSQGWVADMLSGEACDEDDGRRKREGLKGGASRRALEVALVGGGLRDFDSVLKQRELLKLGPPADWSAAHVANWLRLEGFERYADSFATQSVTGEVLLLLTPEDLKEELHVNSFVDRKMLMAAIASLRML